MGGVLACFAICFSGISTVALACCPTMPVPEVLVAPVSPVSPVVEDTGCLSGSSAPMTLSQWCMSLGRLIETKKGGVAEGT